MGWLLASGAAVATLFGIAGVTEYVLAARDQRRFPPPGRLVDIGAGRHLHMVLKGSGPGPTVVIEQGAGSPSIVWWPIQEKLAERGPVCTYDRAGYLWSDPPCAPQSLEDRAADLHALLTRGDVPAPYVLVAHSFGGPLVRLFASAYPGLVAGMVLVDTPEEAVIFRPSYQNYTRNMRLFACVAGGAARVGLVRLALRWMNDKPDGLSDTGFAAFKAALARGELFRRGSDDAAALGLASAPMRMPGGFGGATDKPLVVLSHGQPFPGPAAVLEAGWAEGQARLVALSPHGRLIVAENSNHMVHADAPDAVLDAVRSVLDAVRSGCPQVVA
jgi:pimeloyl-ACP methyl ester carboxylesterase